MVYYLQIGLLMLAAYLFGALFGCLLHRLVSGGSTVRPDFEDAKLAGAVAGAGAAAGAIDPAPVVETVARPEPPEQSDPDRSRFERALVQAPEDTFSPAENDEAEVVVTRHEDAAVIERTEREDEASGALATASAVAAAAAAAAVATQGAGDAETEAPAIASVVFDDLTQIRSIDADMAERLKGLGVSSFAQLATMTAPEVRELGDKLGDRRVISQQNWIEQAHLLANGGSTLHSRTGGLAQRGTWDVQPGEGGYSGPIFGGAMAAAAAATGAAGLAAASRAEDAANDASDAAETASAEVIETTSAEVIGDAAAPEARESVYGLPAEEVESEEPFIAEAPEVDSEPRTAHSWSARDNVYGSGDAPVSGDKGAEAAASESSGVVPGAVAAAGSGAAGVAAAVAGLGGAESSSQVAEAAATAGRKTPQDLRRIRGIDERIAGELNARGVTRYEDISRWTSVDVDEVEEFVTEKGRVGRDGWIEQATMLARGEETVFSRRYDAGLGGRVVSEGSYTRDAGAEREDRGGWGAAARVETGSEEMAADEAAAERAQPVADGGLDQGAGTDDDEGQDSGKSAAAAGLGAVAAAVTAGSVMGRTGEVETGEAETSSGVETPSRTDETAASPAPSGDESQGAGRADEGGAAAAGSVADRITKAQSQDSYLSFRSVRSEALRGSADQPGRAPDDLKRIRGIGMLIEKKLNSMGITTFEQIANWSSADIDRISQILDFKGRIERENWVQQARILSTGGNTEFSRRFDR